MKRFNFPKPTLFLLVTGLFIVSLTPIANRYLHMPDLVVGFLSGLGLTLEVIALAKMDRYSMSLNKRCKNKA